MIRFTTGCSSLFLTATIVLAGCATPVKDYGVERSIQITSPSKTVVTAKPGDVLVEYSVHYIVPAIVIQNTMHANGTVGHRFEFPTGSAYILSTRRTLNYSRSASVAYDYYMGEADWYRGCLGSGGNCVNSVMIISEPCKVGFKVLAGTENIVGITAHMEYGITDELKADLVGTLFEKVAKPGAPSVTKELFYKGIANGKLQFSYKHFDTQTMNIPEKQDLLLDLGLSDLLEIDGARIRVVRANEKQIEYVVEAAFTK